MKNKLLLSLMILISSLSSSFGQNIIFTGKLGSTIHYMEVPNMPISFRNIPIHPDDGGGINTGTISKTSYQNWIVIPTIGFEFSHKFKNRMSIGMGITFEFSWANRAEVNYNSYGSPKRGFGTALTYCGTITRGMFSILTCGQSDDPNFIPTTFNLSLTPNIFFTIPITKKVDIKMNITYQRYSAVNGWDRYNTLEVYQKETLVYIIPVDILFSFKSAEFGPRIPISWRTDAGKDFGSKIFPIGFVINYKLGTDSN